MKKQIIYLLRNKTSKRIISAVLAIAMTFSALPAREIGEESNSFGLFSLVASATDENDPPETNYKFAHDSNNELSFPIEDFYEYSQKFAQYPSYHKSDKITLLTVGYPAQCFKRGFVSLGTSTCPFEGSIEIEDNMPAVLNLDAPLFNYVKDSVELNGGNELEISRFYGYDVLPDEVINKKTPLLAVNVIHDSSNPAATWNISVKKPSATDDPNSDGTLDQFAGLIGTMGTGSSLTLNVTMEKQAGDTDAIIIEGASNLGFACGTMDSNSTLVFSLTDSGSNLRKIGKISTSSGHAGGLVGEMKSGSTFSFNALNDQTDAASISADSGYAGGVIGKINQATVTLPTGAAYTVNQHISGKTGSGGVAGYYKPKADEVTFTLDSYAFGTSTQVNGNGNIGGLFGYFETNHSFKFDSSSTFKSTHAVGDASSYGGLIGKYSSTSSTSLADTLTISNLKTEMNLSAGKITNYGGAIGVVDDTRATYIKFDGFTLNDAKGANGETLFGGLISSAKKTFVDADNVTIKVDGTFKGAGLVGDLGNGAMRLTGTTDLSSAKLEKPTSKTANPYRYGQIVGARDSAPVFAETGWELIRSSEVSGDDIGGWGEVMRFDAKNVLVEEGEGEDAGVIISKTTEEQYTDTVLTVDELAHTITVESPETEITTVAEFAIAALSMQLSSTSITTVTSLGSTPALTLGDNIDLSTTGITGFTRDNDTDGSMTDTHCIFDGTFDAQGYTVTLAIGEVYGKRGETDLSTAGTRTKGDGKIYNHRYNGLFGILSGSVIGDAEAYDPITIDGQCTVSPCANSIYVGALAGVARNSVKVYYTDVTAGFAYEGDQNIYLGRLIGEINIPKDGEDSDTVDIQNCELSGNVSGANASEGTCISGMIGKIYHTANEEQTWNIKSVALSGTIENTAARNEQIMGGLIGKIEGYSATKNFNSRNLILYNITTGELEIKAGAAKSMGGLLGYQWLNTDVDLGAEDDADSRIVIGSDSEVSKLTASGNIKDMAGIVYNATGTWKVYGLDILGIEVDASSPRSFGMIVNKGWYSTNANYKTDGSSSAIYLHLPVEGCYIIDPDNATLDTLENAEVFDELLAYSAYYTDSGDTRSGVDSSGDMYVLKNGAAVVSIHTDTDFGLVMDGDEASLSYNGQTEYGARANPWTRYYYNLESITSGNNAKKLMRWGLQQYAHQSIRANFGSTVSSLSGIGTCNMTGYSWYPVDVETDVTITGTFKFSNAEFEDSELANVDDPDYAKTSLYIDGGTPATTQHYLLHAGLFRNVASGKKITVNNTTKLQGNVGTYGDYCGALVCGTVAGTSDTAKSAITINDLTLDGIYISGIDSDDYAPLIINKVTKYTDLIVSNVDNSDSYKTASKVPYIFMDGGYPKAASSLIGVVGSSTAQGINVTFSLIKLDGRTYALADSSKNTDLDNAYNTYRTLFTKATLLDTFEFKSGSTGKYNYTWANDWGGSRNVTYGKEVGYITIGEFPDRERIYLEEEDATARYTNPSVNNDTDGDTVADVFLNRFLPYVKTGYGDTTTSHQLEVNHRSSRAEGCGTYNDPYKIQSPAELESFAKIINGNCDGTSVILPTSAEMTAHWCDTKTSGGTNHKTYTYDGTNFVNGSDSYTTTEVRTYLAGAYYQLTKSIEINTTTFRPFSDFETIISDSGNANKNDFAVFRGVIDGNGYTITNKTEYPLIRNSYGSVVENLTVAVDRSSASIALAQATKETFPKAVSYGAVIGNVLGGDNIIDAVTVTMTFGSKKYIELSGDYAKLIPVGGYIGVVTDGAVIFRNMTGISMPDTLSKVKSVNASYLYVNPIIGRVLNGYAVTEGSALSTTDSTGTMVNGTKNYSIADIKKNEANKLTTSAYTAVSGASGMYSTDVSIPNAQALFIMSLLTQSSTTIGAPTGLTGPGSSGSYDGSFKTMHHAAYDKVGTDDAKADVADYKDYAVHDSATAGVPYIVENYTAVVEGTSNYGVLALTNNATVCNFSLSGETTSWTLPDGYRGIGAIGFGITSNQDNYLKARTVSLHKLSGLISAGEGEGEDEEDSEAQVVTITMNMSLQHYEGDFDNYLPVNNSKGGFGLFNTLRHNRSDQGAKAADYKISDINITGNIKYYVFNHSKTDGSMTYTTANVHPSGINSYLNTGGIAGYAGFGGADSITVESVGVSGLTVDGFETAGGFFGNLQLANNATNHQVSITNINATSAFTVTSKRYTGGIIGYFNLGNLLIDNVTIVLPNVLTYFIGSNAQDFENGAGGVIGFAKNGSSNKPIEITSVNMGSLESTESNKIGYANEAAFTKNTQDSIAAGGIIGRSHTEGKNGKTYSLLIKDCTINKISVYGHRVGGLIGTDGVNKDTAPSSSYIEINNCHIKSPTDENTRCTLYGKTVGTQHKACGGFIGGIHNKSVILDNCSIEGYILQGYKDTAGLCAWANAGDLTIRNVKIKDLLIKSIYSGCLSGWTSVNVQGYNILCDNVQFQSDTGGSSMAADNGYLIGKAKAKVMLVGVSRQNMTPAEGCFVPERLAGIGSGALAIDNSANRYAIFADYLGTASDTNKLFANVDTGSTNVLNYEGSAVTDNKPYVTSSPSMYIDPVHFLTGDALNGTFNQVIVDKGNNTTKSYQLAPAIDNNKLQDVNEHLSTSREEFNVANFPILTVEESDRQKVTNYINYYIQNLTNTNFNYALPNQAAYKVTIHKCTYEDDPVSGRKVFVVGTNGTGTSLKHYTASGKEAFAMDSQLIDNFDPNSPQFTLMDVQFYDPSSNKTKIAYHLYIPIYVKKLIQYKFSAKIVSGTNYYDSAYSSVAAGNSVFQNMGDPVTIRIEYEYDRDEEDWTTAINGGENVLGTSNYYKSLKLAVNSNGWAPNSRLVLVDANNMDKHYYSDGPTDISDNKGHIKFEDFTSDGTSSGTPYTHAPFNSLLTIECAKENNGPLIAATVADGTVMDSSGNYYKPRPESGTGSTAQGYRATVTEVKPEVYYLSLFTNKNSNNKVYVYQINSDERFDRHDSDDTEWRPNKVISSSYNRSVSLVTGNLYTDSNFSVSVLPNSYEMTKTNNILTVTMTSHVALTDAATTLKIDRNLALNPNSTIFQTFLMNFDSREKNETTSKIGVATKAIKSITPISYKIYAGTSVIENVTQEDYDNGTVKDVLSLGSFTDPESLMNSNYIELRNGVNLNSFLSNDDNSNAATIQTQFAIEYNTALLNEQFPHRTNKTEEVDVGALVRGFSNISSVEDGGAYSSTSTFDQTQKRYFTTDLSAATLSYNVNRDYTSHAGYNSQLGVNPFDENTGKTGKGHIDSSAIYTFTDINDPADYIEFTLVLTSKDDGYDTTPLVFADYLSQLQIKAGNTTLYTQGSDTDTSSVKAYMKNNGTMIVLRAEKSNLTRIADKIYSIDISFDVLTGESNGFGTGKAYSNYKLALTADLYDDLATDATPDQLAHDSDHIIYTNSKLQYKMIT